MTELQHDQVTIAGTEVHTVTAGPPDAPGLLLLHGWPESRRAGVADVTPAVVTGAGHFPHQEAPGATWQAISKFISGTGSGEG